MGLKKRAPGGGHGVVGEHLRGRLQVGTVVLKFARASHVFEAGEALRQLLKEGLGKRAFNGVVIEGLALQVSGR